MRTQPGVDFGIQTAHYTARMKTGGLPVLEIEREGQTFFWLPVVSGLERGEKGEQLANIRVLPPTPGAENTVELVATADSSLWQQRRFVWTFREDRIEYRHFARGQGQVGRCFFCADTLPAPWLTAGAAGVDHQAQVFARRVFMPRPNLGNRFEYSEQSPQSIGIVDECMEGVNGPLYALAFDPEKAGGTLYCPPPLAMCFGMNGPNWAALGLGARPGEYAFHAFNYSGTRQLGAAFFVDYRGGLELAAGAEFESPTLALHFGFSEWEALRRSVEWVYQNGFGTEKRFENPTWHREPIFCGWAEQTYLAHIHTTGGSPVLPASLATQSNYEGWVDELERKGLPFGTLVIDDKWQSQYGTFEVDLQKWPDMPGFIQRQHAKGRHVLLWVPGHHVEGLPEEWCLADGERKVAADVTHPAYEAYLRAQIRKLIGEVDADGFKEDWIGGVTFSPQLNMHAPLYGMEFLRRFQWILYDEAHKVKPGALIETQTPHPLLRESSDMIRLNDLFFGTRNAVETMESRARIARSAGWELVDCDNASSSGLEQWWAYMQAQPGIGVPSLYCLTGMESTAEPVPARCWPFIADLWQEYRQRNGL